MSSRRRYTDYSISTSGYSKPKGLLKDIQQPRIRPKSAFLRRLEAMQKKAQEEAARKVTPLFRRTEGGKS